MPNGYLVSTSSIHPRILRTFLSYFAQNFYVLKIRLNRVLKGEMHKKAYEHIWLRFFQFLTDFHETFSKCLIQDFLKPHKVSAFLDNFFFHSFQGGTKGKKLKNQKKRKKCSQMCSQAFLCISPFKFIGYVQEAGNPSITVFK